MKYIELSSGGFASVYENNDELKQLQSLPKGKITFFNENAKEVVEYFAKQEEVAKFFEAKQAAKAAAQQKLAKATGLTIDEIKALFA